ncbi:MAG: glycosyltransferase family 61 protein [Caulobacter sp.]|nr:glycosyltransferase family 61 protein [Caulobacter sp.]
MSDDWTLTTLRHWSRTAPGAAFHSLRPAARPRRDRLERLAVPAPELADLAARWAAVGEPEHFVAVVPDALVRGPEGLVGSGGALFYDSLQALHRLSEAGFEPAEPLPAPPDWQASVVVPERLIGLRARPTRPMTPARSLPGTSLMLGFMWDHNWYHWLVEALPRAGLAARVGLDGVDRLLLLEPRHSFKTETLALTGLDRLPVAWVGAETVACERLVFPSRLQRSGFASAEAPGWLRRRLLGLRRFLGRGRRRLFVSRQDAPARRLLNEDEVFDILRPFGFERLRSAGLSVAAQIAAFAQARTVFAPHGAGLANCVFMPRGSLVIDLMSRSYPNPSYWALAGACRHRYQPVIAPEARDGGDFELPAGQARDLARALFA